MSQSRHNLPVTPPCLCFAFLLYFTAAVCGWLAFDPPPAWLAQRIWLAAVVACTLPVLGTLTLLWIVRRRNRREYARRVLVVESDRAVRRRLVGIVSRAGFWVDAVASPELARTRRLDRSDVPAPDLILVRWCLPQAGAREILQLAASGPAVTRWRVLMLATASEAPAARAALAEFGLGKLITEPVSPEELCDAVHRSVDGDRRACATTLGGRTGPGWSDDGLLGRRLLLVDDSPFDQMVLLSLLRTVGVDVEIATAEADVANLVRDRMAEDKPYHAVVVAHHMPNATEIVRQLRATGSSAHLPILALTAEPQNPSRSECLPAGMDDVLRQPVGPSTLEILARSISASAANQKPCTGSVVEAPGRQGATREHTGRI